MVSWPQTLTCHSDNHSLLASTGESECSKLENQGSKLQGLLSRESRSACTWIARFSCGISWEYRSYSVLLIFGDICCYLAMPFRLWGWGCLKKEYVPVLVVGVIEVVIHHGGKLVNEGCLRYEGQFDTMHFDPDYWSYYVVTNVVKALGYVEFQELWYSVGCGPVLDGKLEALSDDVGAMHMVNLARLNGRVHLYVVHSVSQAEVIQMIEYNVHEEQLDDGVQHEGGESAKLDEEVQVHGGETEGIQNEEGVNEETVEVHVDGKEVEVDVGDSETIQNEEGVNEETVQVHVDGEEVEVDVGESETIQNEETVEVHVDGEEVQVDVGETEEGHDDETIRVDVEGEVNTTIVNDWSSSDDDIGEVNIMDGEVNIMDDEVHSVDGLVDVNIQCDFSQRDSSANIEVDCSVISESDFEQHESDLEEHDISDSKSEELTSPDISDEETDVEEGYGNFVTFTMPKKMVDFKWEVGTYFGQKVDILDTIKTYALENGKKLKFIKNDKRRIRIKCMGAKGQCPWMAYFGYMEAMDTWQLRTVIDEHTCSREHKLGVFNARWLSKKLEKTVRENPTIKGLDIRDKISRKWNIAISKNMAYRAKAFASDEVEGSFIKQYTRIYDYAHELLARNPGSTIKVKLEENDQKRIFQRFYACLKACKDSFMSCRPVIGLDGAFLKGRYGGELLTAVARDANDQMMPLAYVVVEVENKETWKWFMELLIEDLGGPDFCSSLTLISDQQKGLLHAVDDLLPGIAHRYCVRHLYANFRKKFPGKNLKKLMWRATLATHPQKWETEMRNIREVNQEAFRHLMAFAPRFWSRSRFTTTAQCDTLVNNMTEAFNSVFVHTRTKPIITMLEEIRLYIMKRWATNRSRVNSFKSAICPKILSRLRKEALLTQYWIPSTSYALLMLPHVDSWSAEKIFEVRHVSHTGDKYVVNIDESSCSCRKWSLSGIPCAHALTTMRFLNLNEEDYIPACFHTSTYQQIYSSIIYPINGNNLWEVTQYEDVMPPSKRKLPSRPKKKRRLEQWELKKDSTRMTKGGLLKRYSNCREVGHNKKRCPKTVDQVVLQSQGEATTSQDVLQSQGEAPTSLA
ncbi:hypothetical protein V8G54_015681 [Vigna mungo]|uniref:SWIM-type domain-containing protein n=1 Tax=Vigna mungo TaxID=3915 RepID=A0AAQ3NLQ5_VIGMU